MSVRLPHLRASDASTMVGHRRRLIASALSGVLLSGSFAGAAERPPAGDRLLTFDPATSSAADAPSSGGRASGDATLAWTGLGGASRLWSNGLNWSSFTAPGGGDSLDFGPALAGNYITVNDKLTTSFATLLVSRAGPSETVTLQGGYAGAQLQVAAGRLVLDGGSYAVNAPGNTAADVAILAGNGAGSNGSIVIQNNAQVAYANARTGFGTSVGSLLVTGGATVLNPLVPGTTASTFGGSTGTNTVVVDNGAIVNAYRASAGTTGLFAVRNNGTVNLAPLTAAGAAAPLAAFGTAANAVVTLELSNGGKLSTPDVRSQVQIGLGANATTTVNVTGGGKLTGGIIVGGGAINTTTPLTSNTTLNVDGVGSEIVATGVFSTNGSAKFADTFIGTTFLNLTRGGKLTAPLVALNDSNRPATVGGSPAPASITTVVLDGAGSTISSRVTVDDPATTANEIGTGAVVAGYGNRTTSYVTVRNGALIDADAYQLGEGGGLLSNTALATGGRINTNFVLLGTQNSAAGGSSAQLDINTGATVNTIDLRASTGSAAQSVININGATSALVATGLFEAGGFNTSATSTSTLGAGRTTLTVNGSASASFGRITAGVANAGTGNSDVLGTTLIVNDTGSVVRVVGAASGGGTDGTAPVPALVVLGSGTNTRAAINVGSGGLFDIRQSTAAPNHAGELQMSINSGTTSSVTVDGIGSTFHAGTFASLSVARTAATLTNATSAINVRNGGYLDVAGDVAMSTVAGSGLSATINLGLAVGALAADPDSAITADGILYVGGSGPTLAPILGSPATVNVNNGLLSVGGLAVYGGSNVNVARGTVRSGIISAIGGTVSLSPTAAAGSALLISDEYEAVGGGTLDIGRGGGASYLVTHNGQPDADLAEIKNLILAGYNGGAWDGTNAIRSSVITPGGSLAIGYADIDAINLTSFLGVVFNPADGAVVFRTTLKGDSNVDGTVNFDDLLTLAQNYDSAAGGREWYQGDSTYDGVVSFDDLLALAQNYNGSYSLTGGPSSAAAASADAFAADWALARSMVPEPTTLALLGGVALVARRRRLR